MNYEKTTRKQRRFERRLAERRRDRELIRKGHELKAQERKRKSVCFSRER